MIVLFATVNDRQSAQKGAETPEGDQGKANLAKLRRLKEQLKRNGWKKDTSYWPDRWLAERPSTGQCAVTALLIQDFFGGDIVEATTDTGDTHFFNYIPGLGSVDLTDDQFDPQVEIHFRGVAVRHEMLSFPGTVRRYNLLKRAVQGQL